MHFLRPTWCHWKDWTCRIHSFFLAWIHFYLLLSTIYLTFECLSYFSDHFLKLKIYYGELNFEVIEEEEAYTVSICIITKNWICLVVLLQVSNSCCLTKYFGLNPSSVGGMIEPRHTKKKCEVVTDVVWARCQTCKHKTSRTFLKDPKSAHNTRDHITRPSENIAYCISCRRCNCLYTGETRRRLRERFQRAPP